MIKDQKTYMENRMKIMPALRPVEGLYIKLWSKGKKLKNPTVRWFWVIDNVEYEWYVGKL